jgi:hypothetical protein
MCTVLLPLGANPIVVKCIISHHITLHNFLHVRGVRVKLTHKLRLSQLFYLATPVLYDHELHFGTLYADKECDAQVFVCIKLVYELATNGRL